MAELLPYLGICVLLFFSAFFSGSEIAFSSVSPLRLRQSAEGGNAAAKTALSICQSYDQVLCAILIGNNLVNIASSSVATLIAIQLAGPGGAMYATAVMTVLILIFGEIMPKILAKEHCDGFVLKTAYPLRFLMTVTRPLVVAITWIVDHVSRLWGGTPPPEPITPDELLTIIETVEDEGVIDEERSDLLRSAVGFGERTVEEILTPRVELQAIDLQDSRDEILRQMDASPFSRLPVYDEDLDSITGILFLNHAYRMLAKDRQTPISDMVFPAFFLHRSTRLPVALREMRQRNTQLAVVLDDFGGTCGVVTIEDILEELVGDIWDESDPIEVEFRKIDDFHFQVSGSMSLSDLLWELDLEQYEDAFDSATVGGWVIEQLGRFPAVNDQFTWNILTVTVEATDENRVSQILIEAAPPSPDDEDDED